MHHIIKINVLTLIFLHLAIVNCDDIETKDDLVQSESKDGTLEIVKQIKKVNNDGSYTVGYEADDGSFKIESRDVLGNIKGTYGYVDDSGKIKRVSYSSTNSSEIIHKIESDSVVQRIPKFNRTESTTGRPFYSSSTSSTPLLKRKNLNFVSSTTSRPSLNNEKDLLGKSTTRPQLVYATSPTPRSRFLLKSEGQLPRPEELVRPTELPLFKRLALNHPISDTKPVTEEPELKGNILRRQLHKDTDYDPHQHLYTIQQSLGSDSSDVYTASMATGTVRPLFTTTNRPIRLSSTTASPIRRATVRYPKNLQSSSQHKEQVSTTTEHQNNEQAVSETTPTSVPVVQIPPNRAHPETLVAIRHPYQRETVLVPLSHLQRRLIPFASPRDINDNIQGYVQQIEPYVKEATSSPDYAEEPSKPEYTRRVPQPLRPRPVQIDENGYVRQYPTQTAQHKIYAVPLPVQAPRYVQEVPSNSIENIQPPVSVRDFQIILQQLELRQKRLERLHELTDPRRNPLFRGIQQNQFYNRFAPQNNPNGPVQFLQVDPEDQRRRIYNNARQNHYSNQDNQYDEEQFSQSYVPTKRVARLLKDPNESENDNEDYLPPDIREMLLLKMLQLAMNPAMPVDNEGQGSETTTVAYRFKKDPSRNVEILGEEIESSRRPPRVKRFKEADDLEYTE